MDLEPDLIASHPLDLEFLGFLDPPSLVGMVVASVPNEIRPLVVILTGLDALASWVLEVLLGAIDILEGLEASVVLSGNQVDVMPKLPVVVSVDGSDGPVSSVGHSDALGSQVKHPLLVLVRWIEVVHSEVDLVSTGLLGFNNSLSVLSSEDVELDSVSQREVWLELALLHEFPSLVEMGVTLEPADGVVFSVSVVGDIHALA